MFIEEKIIEMHYKCAQRENASTSIIKAMAQLSKPFNDAVAAALLSMGGKHAPVREAQICFTSWRMARDMKDEMAFPPVVPGFGSAWFKKQRDPDVETFLNELFNHKDFQHLADDLDVYTNLVRKFTGKDIYPNAAMATSVANIALKRPPELAVGLVIQGRISAWEEIYYQNLEHKGF
jgi:hypothetical protein